MLFSREETFITEKQKTTEQLTELTDAELDLVTGGSHNQYGTYGGAPARTDASPNGDTAYGKGHGGF